MKKNLRMRTIAIIMIILNLINVDFFMSSSYVYASESELREESYTLEINEDTKGNITFPEKEGYSLNVGSACNGNAMLEGVELTYLPNENFHGEDKIEYTYTPVEEGETISGYIDVMVKQVNDPPVAMADSFDMTNEDILEMNVLENDYDVDEDALAITSIDTPSNGTASINEGIIIYTPHEGYVGEERIGYTISDNEIEATSYVDINIINPLRDITDDSSVQEESESELREESYTLEIDEDTKGNMTFSEKEGYSLNVGSASNGNAMLEGLELTYLPNENFHGEDKIEYTYTPVEEGETISGYVDVMVKQVNDPPIAMTDSFNMTNKDILEMNVLENDYDVDQDALAITSIDTPSNGSVSINEGLIIYTPNEGYVGEERIGYIISDNEIETKSYVDINITNPLNDVIEENNVEEENIIEESSVQEESSVEKSESELMEESNVSETDVDTNEDTNGYTTNEDALEMKALENNYNVDEEPVNDVIEAELYLMENYTSMNEKDVAELIWPEIELNEIEMDRESGGLKLYAELIEDYDKEIKSYGYVWSYDYEEPTVSKNEGFIEIGKGAEFNSFEHIIDSGRTVYIRAYTIYNGNYVGYSNQRQYSVENISMFTMMRSFAFESPKEFSTGKTYFKDTGDDLDKLRIAVGPKFGCLKIDLDIDELPTESAYLVLRGKFGGFAHLNVNGRFMGYIGASLSNEYYAIKLHNDFIKEGKNTIEMYVYGLAWAKLDSISVVVDGGDKSKGEISKIGFDDWNITYNSNILHYYTDFYAKTTTQNINTTQGLKLVNSIGLYGQNHFSSSDYLILDNPDKTYHYRITLPDDEEAPDEFPDETGNWRLYSMIVENKKVLTVENKGFYYIDSLGPRNFGLDFTQDTYNYTNGSVTITATVDDLFKRPFSHIVLPDGSKVYDYLATYTISSNNEYKFKVVEPDGTETVFAHKVTNIDKTDPLISTIGDSTVTLIEESSYVDMGVTVSDDLSGFSSYKPTIDYNGLNIESAQPGTYTIKYTIADRAGNTNSTTRTVIVKNKPLEVSTENITKTPTEVTPTEVSLQGRIKYFGEEEIVEKGLVWGCISNPTVEKNDGIHILTTDIVNKESFTKVIPLNTLMDGVMYNVRAYAKTSSGRIVYGTNKTFEASDKNYGVFQLNNTSYSIKKGSNVTFNIERIGGSDTEVKVFYRTINGSAISGTQFNDASGYVTFGDGDSSTKSVTVNTKNYYTWEKTNREFYFEIYKIEGKGNIGVNNIGTVKFTDGIDTIENISNNSWDNIWDTGNDYLYKTDGSRYFPSESGISILGYQYWQSQANSFLGRTYGDIYTYAGDVGLGIEKYTTSWKSVAYVIFTGSDAWEYVYKSGSNINDASKLRIKVKAINTDDWNGGEAGVQALRLQIKITDSTAPTINSFHTINGSYAEGDTVYISAKFNEIVNVSDLSALNLNVKLYNKDGSEFVQKAAYVTGNNTDTLVFKFTVPESKYNTKLEFAATKFDNPNSIKDLVGNAFNGSAAPVINEGVKIASTTHDITFSPNGNSLPRTGHSTQVIVSKNVTDPAIITEREYLWATDTNTKIKGFKSFNSGDVLTIEGATGNYYLHVKTKDDYGNETYAVSNAFVLNNTEPTFLLTANTKAWTKNDVTITLDNIPEGATILKRQYKEGFFSIEDFGTGTDFVGNSFTVSKNGIYTVFLETDTGKKYVNSIDIKNIDKNIPELIIVTDGSGGNVFYQASTEVTATDEGNSELNTLQYAWTNISEKPTSGWIDFKSGDRLEKNTSGTWYLHVKAIDNAGNERYMCSNTFMVDNNGPTIDVTGTNPEYWTNEPVTININATKDNLNYVMMPDLTTVEAVNGTVNTTFTVTKNGYYSFVAVDESGNTAEASINITRLDTDAPNVTVIKSQEGWTNSDIVLTISADDDVSVIHDNNGDVMGYSGVGGISIKRPDSETFEAYTSPFAYTVTSNGLYQVSVTDSLGNTTTRNINISNIDKTPPFVEADNTDYGAKKDPISIRLFYRDKEMGIVRSKEYKITGDTTTPLAYDAYDGTPIILSNEGTYYIHYRAADEVNNITTGYFGPYTISSSVPSITIQADDSGIYKKSHSAKIVVDFNGLSLGDIKYQWTNSLQIPSTNWNALVENNGTVDKSSVDGDYYLHINVSAGGSNYYASKLFKFDNTPPIVTLKGDNPTNLAYGDTYVERGVEYRDTYDLWPKYTEPNLNIIKNNSLGTYILNYIVTDNAGNSTTVSRIVNVKDVTPPVVSSVSLTVDEDNILSCNDDSFVASYNDLSGLSKIKVLSLPSNGNLKLRESDIAIDQVINIEDIDNITYIPNDNWNGSTSFNYSAFDSYENESNNSMVNITVKSINDNPCANNDIDSTDEDNSITFNVLNNDTDIETDTINLVVQAITQGEHGTVLNNNDGTLTYYPDKNWHGTDSFTYTVKDSDNGTNSGTVTITVNPVNDLPKTPTMISISGSSPYKGNENVTISWDAAVDVDGDILVYELDYFDGLNWNSIETNITETSKSFTIPCIDIKSAKLRIRTYDKKEWSSDYLESSIFEIDSTKPQVALSTNNSEWVNADITVNFSSDDNGGSGIADTEYSYTKLLSLDNWSNWTGYKSGSSFNFTNDGVYKLKVRTIDNAGNLSDEKFSGEYKIDKTVPEAFVPNLFASSKTEIKISGTATDSTENSTVVSGLEEMVYDYSIDGVYCGAYETGGIHTFKGLTPNKEYTFKMKAKDKVGNEIETVEVKGYTKAEEPSGSTLGAYTKDTLNITLISSEENVVAPEYEVWLTLKDDNDIVKSTVYSRETVRSFTGLTENTEYDLWTKVRNEDGVENSAVKIGTYKTNKVPIIAITNKKANIYKKSGETIEISGIVTDDDNEDVTISATINGKTKDITVSNTASSASWTLSWDIDTDIIDENNYKGMVITAVDVLNDSDIEDYIGDIIVDKTAPNLASITVNEEWSCSKSESVKITDSDDLGNPKSGVERIEYKLTGVESTDGFIEYTGEFNVSTEGITEITTRVIDKAGNISLEASKMVHIDKTNPIVSPTAVTGTVFTNGKTNGTVDWTNADYTVDMTYTDEVGIDKIYYKVTGDTNTPTLYDDFMNENVSKDSTVKSALQKVNINVERQNYIHYKIVDLAGNIETGFNGPYKLDKTNLNMFNLSIEAVSRDKITINGITTDSTTNSPIVSGLEEILYDYSIDGIYNGVYETDGAYTFTGLEPNKEYTFKMKAKDKAGNEIETLEIITRTKSIPSSTPEESDLVGISVDEESVNTIGEVTVENEENGQTRIGITLDNKSVIEMLDNDKYKDILSIATETNCDVVVEGLNGQAVKEMEDKSVRLEIKNEMASYTLPAKEINIESIAETFGEQVKLKDIKVEIGISKPQEVEIKKIEGTAEKMEYELVVTPVNFEIKCRYDNKIVEVSKFNHYVERLIEIPKGVVYDRITTGVVFDEKGDFYHVPTKVVEINEKYYAKINSLTNSSYTMIWNPVEFKDVQNHWAKEAVNDMGSRLVISGTGNNLFNPDRDITRAEFAAIVVRALGLKPKTENKAFVDVKDTDWYNSYIETAFEYKIIFGYDNKKFRPMDKITREEAMVMISRAMGITGLKMELKTGETEKLFEEFNDSDTLEEWTKNYIAVCIKAGIISGKNGKLIAPKDSITRAEVAAIVRRLLQKSDLI